jgi:hypothetical protein
MNLLVLCPHFAPDVAPTGEVMTAIAAALADRGHRLHVVTALPWYRQHKVEDGWGGRPWRTETTDWGWITRLHPFPTDKTNIPARAVAFGGFKPGELAFVEFTFNVGDWRNEAYATKAAMTLTSAGSGGSAERTQRYAIAVSTARVTCRDADETPMRRPRARRQPARVRLCGSARECS